MNELEKLRPEVRNAFLWISDYFLQDDERVCAVRAELLRLADENAQLRDLLADRDMDREMRQKANAELAAIKSATCEWRHDLDEDTWDSACGARWMFDEGGPEENDVRFCQGCGKRVRLVVDDPPGKTSDQ